MSAYALQREQGPRRWRFVVVDVDLHNALQGCHFDNAIAKLRQAFPNSQFVQSSSSGGVHVYVPLPRGIGYEEGALWLRAFVELNDLRFVEASAAGRTLRAQLVEVPRNPPRLPFGVGSHLLGDTRPLADQAQDFMIEIRGAASTDFDRARGSIEEHLGLTGVDARPAARRLDAFLLARETATMVQRNLDPNDPWMAVLDRLPHSSRRRIQRVVAGGVPAYGTRTRWTISLIAAIADHVSPAEAESLMLYWLRDPGRKHVSQEVEFDREPAEEQTVELVRDAYEHIHGVPERFWNDIGSAVRSRYRKAGSTLPFTQDDAIATAFQIARRFYSVGKRTRPVGAWEFGMFCGKNGAHAMQDLLTRGPDWLRWKAPAVQGREGRRFELVQHLWPMRPREPVRFAP